MIRYLQLNRVPDHSYEMYTLVKPTNLPAQHNVLACTFSLNAESRNQIFQTNPYTLNMTIDYYNCFEITFSVHI